MLATQEDTFLPVDDQIVLDKVTQTRHILSYFQLVARITGRIAPFEYSLLSISAGAVKGRNAISLYL